MTVQCPTITDTLVFADDAQLAAKVSCILARRGSYLPVIDGPRLQRPDRDQEVIRRGNAAARSKAEHFVFVGLSPDSVSALGTVIPAGKTIAVGGDADLARLETRARALKQEPLQWGRDRIGIGLLKALRSGQHIVLNDAPSPRDNVPPKSDHLVVCEENEELAQVIAANYAFSVGAGLCLIPETTQEESERILENFYSLYDTPGVSPSEMLERLRQELRERAGPLPIPAGGSITFISDHLPYGFAFNEVPSTHLIRYPDLGLAVVHGFAAEQDGTRGVQVATMINPDTTPAPEINAAVDLLRPHGIFIRVYEGPNADVTSVSEMVQLFPYDLLVIATHCGDVSGYRWTYEYIDSEGLSRTLVVDIAVGLGRTDDKDMLHVSQFTRFVSLDDIDWNDPEKSKKVYVGSAIIDFIERTSKRKEMEPVKKEDVPRVVGSAALKMADSNYLAFPRSLANEGTPIIINNACVSWHQLAKTFVFAGARAYVGTLFPVVTSEAEAMVVRILGKHFGKPLAGAVWSAQREVYGNGNRRPYVVCGVYPQRLRTTRDDVPTYIAQQLARGLRSWERFLTKVDSADTEKVRAVGDCVKYYERELKWFDDSW